MAAALEPSHAVRIQFSQCVNCLTCAKDRLLPGLQLFEQRQARLQFGLQQAARLRGQRDDVIADALPELRRGGDLAAEIALGEIAEGDGQQAGMRAQIRRHRRAVGVFDQIEEAGQRHALARVGGLAQQALKARRVALVLVGLLHEALELVERLGVAEPGGDAAIGLVAERVGALRKLAREPRQDHLAQRGVDHAPRALVAQPRIEQRRRQQPAAGVGVDLRDLLDQLIDGRLRDAAGAGRGRLQLLHALERLDHPADLRVDHPHPHGERQQQQREADHAGPLHAADQQVARPHAGARRARQMLLREHLLEHQVAHERHVAARAVARFERLAGLGDEAGEIDAAQEEGGLPGRYLEHHRQPLLERPLQLREAQRVEEHRVGVVGGDPLAVRGGLHLQRAQLGADRREDLRAPLGGRRVEGLARRRPAHHLGVPLRRLRAPERAEALDVIAGGDHDIDGQREFEPVLDGAQLLARVLRGGHQAGRVALQEGGGAHHQHDAVERAFGAQRIELVEELQPAARIGAVRRAAVEHRAGGRLGPLAERIEHQALVDRVPARAFQREALLPLAERLRVLRADRFEQAGLAGPGLAEHQQPGRRVAPLAPGAQIVEGKRGALDPALRAGLGGGLAAAQRRHGRRLQERPEPGPQLAGQLRQHGQREQGGQHAQHQLQRAGSGCPAGLRLQPGGRFQYCVHECAPAQAVTSHSDNVRTGASARTTRSPTARGSRSTRRARDCATATAARGARRGGP